MSNEMQIIIDALICKKVSEEIIEKYGFIGKKATHIAKILAEYQAKVTTWNVRLHDEALLRNNAKKDYIVLDKAFKNEKLEALTPVISFFKEAYLGIIGETSNLQDANKKNLLIGDVVLCSNNKTFECHKGIVVNIYKNQYSFESIILMGNDSIICDKNAKEWTINKSSQLTIDDVKIENIKVVQVNEITTQEN